MKEAQTGIDIDLAGVGQHGEEAERTGKPVFFREHQRPGWTGKLPLYVIWCEDCDDHTVTHPAGYTGRLHCRLCQKRLHVLHPKGDAGVQRH